MFLFSKAVRHTTAATLIFAAAGFAAQAEEFVMATGQQGGSWYPVGGAIKAIVEREHPDITITVTPGAGVSNVVGVDAGRFAIAFANSISTVDSLSGKEPFRKPTTNVCNLGTLYPQYFQIVALADSGIKTVADMKGKDLTTQQLGNTGEFLTRELLSTAGLTYDDMGSVAHTSYSDSASQMKDGHADFFTLGSSLPTGSVMDLASSREISLVDVDPETFKHFKDQNAAFQLREVKAGAYPGFDEVVHAISYDTHMVAPCDYNGDTIKAVLSAIADNSESFGAISKTMASLTIEEMATDIGVPFHPAAKEFYAERGVAGME
ncbi:MULTISPECIES: TAXI family TRAP transporter solute-binding subunit [Roseobacteraceae]|jgi:TRAP transporter TAXI family solute receptor|uniref:NMT1-like family protein n=1 Tax=Pseudosulfitobacter pseudonitzschiae TaxID=1402135 RepID=A0A221K7F0_9RHOB|nr:MULTISPECIES: TAXI family TRAP transporter solute-binding subunit [Roseobacteraceae]ASM74777.1 NMT1-like family protein [Pseudosulfitobacter pseudonitzschiae]